MYPYPIIVSVAIICVAIVLAIYLMVKDACKHKYKEIRRKFSRPRVSKTSGPPWLVERSIFGVTVVELQCEKCGSVRHIQTVGEV